MSDSLAARVIKRHGLAALAGFTPDEIAETQCIWDLWARPEQLEPPGDWRVWMVLAGRGWGKSRVGAETVRSWALTFPGCHIALVGKTIADVRDVMVRALRTSWNGGRLNLSSPGWPNYEPSKRQLTWRNGSRATTYSAEEPNQLRGPQHDRFWGDELAAWPAQQTREREIGTRSVMEEMWHEGIMMGLRGSGECTVDIGRPCGIVTTTPRARPLIRELLTDSTVVVTRGTTYDNAANLPTQYIADIRSRYEGTRLGRQEIHAEILDDMPGAMWSYAMIDDHRVIKHPDLVRVAVGVDPSGTTRDGNEQGIVVCGLGVDGHGYVLDDRSTHDTPDGWGKRVVMAYIDHKADLIVVERNFGGDMATNTISQAAKALGVQVNIFDVTASRGKVVRAEPVSALYEQGRIHHVGEFPELEDQLRSYVPKNGTSPDRMDAMVWAFTKLMLGDYVTLGEGNVVDGARRGTERSDDDEEVDSRW